MSTDRTPPLGFGRAGPLFLLVVCGAAILLLLPSSDSSRALFPVAFPLMTAFGALSAVGCLHPPIFYAIGQYGANLSLGYKLLAALVFCVGSGIGLYVAHVVN